MSADASERSAARVEDAATGHSATLPRRNRERIIAVGSVVAFVLCWHFLALLAGRTPNGDEPYVPAVWDLVGSFKALGYYWRGGLGVPAVADGGTPTYLTAVLSLLQHSVATIGRLATGFACGAVVAGLAACLVGMSKVARAMFVLPAHIARMLPLMAMIPLFGIWFGNSEIGALTFVSFGTFAIVFMSALTAIGSIPPYYEQYARSQGAGRLRAYLTTLPCALPSLRGGVMLALGFGWSMVIAAEYIGQTIGVGAVVKIAELFGQTGALAVLAAFVVVYAWVCHQVVSRAFDRLLAWYE